MPDQESSSPDLDKVGAGKVDDASAPSIRESAVDDGDTTSQVFPRARGRPSLPWPDIGQGGVGELHRPGV